MEYVSGTKFMYQGIEWTIQEVYILRGKVHSFNAMAYTGYYRILTFAVLENEQRVAA